MAPCQLQTPREEAFALLFQDAQSCQRCPRMKERKRVLGPLNGSLSARILFVAEAPGRLGAERYGVPLFGDQTGKNFEYILERASLRREEVFVTNAVLCNPVDEEGNNDKPSRTELSNCNHHLAATIAVLQPMLVIALGVAALDALNRVQAHSIRLRDNLGSPVPWFDRYLAPLYHPSPRTRVFRRLEEQADDLVRCLAILQHA